MKNYILYEDGSKEELIGYSTINGNILGAYAPSGYYTWHEEIIQHPESGLCCKVPVFEKRILVEDYYDKSHIDYIRVNNIKEIVIEFPNKETL